MINDGFISKITHDLRAPLRALRELPTWVEEDLSRAPGEVPAEVRKMLAMMRTEATRLDLLVVGLSTWARLGRTEERAWTEMGEVAACWEGKLAADIRLGGVAMEAGHLRLVLDQLVGNAFEHGEAASLGATLTVAPGTEGAAVIAVSDRGPGLAEGDRQRVLAPLAKLGGGTSGKGGGMGLALVARVAELYGGTFRMEAGPDGRGAAAVLTVPSEARVPALPGALAGGAG